MSRISTTGPSYRAGYEAGLLACTDAQAAAADEYQRGYEEALAFARQQWVERVAAIQSHAETVALEKARTLWRSTARAARLAEKEGRVLDPMERTA